jgi:hypothetical protein
VARQRLTRAWIAAASIAAAVALHAQEQPGASRARAPLTFLQIDDVYATTPVDGAGGLARVATLEQQIASERAAATT